MAQMEGESFAGGQPPAAEDSLRRARAALDGDSALISFHVGSRASWMWAVDRDGIELYQLPPRDALKPVIAEAAAEIREGKGASGAGSRLYRMLFGSLSPRFQSKRRWLLALDDALFEVPFAALPITPGWQTEARALQNTGQNVQFLVERRTTEIIPSAAYWLDRGHAPELRPRGGFFLGIGDPIYNSADPRLSNLGLSKKSRSVSPLNLNAAQPVPLPRLPASAAELDACARAWNGGEVLLEGANATRRAIAEQFGRHPDVLHFATHFVPSAEAEPQGNIALSLDDSGVADVLRPAEVARWHTNAELVVLSGCHSAAGAVLPGTGLLGLNRAWLAAGARNVISSHWAVPDESGSLFAVLYRNLSGGGQSAPQALRAAQLEMLRAGGWRALPQYWGAYFAMGKE
jgi:CHAT domain-containing protein